MTTIILGPRLAFLCVPSLPLSLILFPPLPLPPMPALQPLLLSFSSLSSYLKQVLVCSLGLRYYSDHVALKLVAVLLSQPP